MFDNIRLRDLLGSSPKELFGAVFGVLIVALFVSSLSSNADDDIVGTYLPFLVVPFVGYIAGRYLAVTFYEPRGKLLIHPRLDGSRIGFLEVPDEIFKKLTPRGNSMVFHTDLGTEAYFIKAADFEKGHIEWGDCHEHDPFRVLTYIDSYNAFRQDYTDTKLKYLRILHYPEVIAAGITEHQLHVVLDSLMSELKVPADTVDKEASVK